MGNTTANKLIIFMIRNGRQPLLTLDIIKKNPKINDSIDIIRSKINMLNYFHFLWKCKIVFVFFIVF